MLLSGVGLLTARGLGSPDWLSRPSLRPPPVSPVLHHLCPMIRQVWGLSGSLQPDVPGRTVGLLSSARSLHLAGYRSCTRGEGDQSRPSRGMMHHQLASEEGCHACTPAEGWHHCPNSVLNRSKAPCGEPPTVWVPVHVMVHWAHVWRLQFHYYFMYESNNLKGSTVPTVPIIDFDTHRKLSSHRERKKCTNLPTRLASH